MIIEKEIKNILAEILETTPDEIVEDNITIYGLNSFKALELAQELEHEYQIRLPKESLNNLTSLNNTIKVVNDLLHRQDREVRRYL